MMPSLNGLQFRNLEGESDFEGMSVVRQQCRERDQIDESTGFDTTPTAQDLRQSFASADSNDVLLVSLHGTVIGYSHFFGWQEASGAWVYVHVGWLIPEQRGFGIGTAMVNWIEKRIREVAQRDHPDELIEIGANASSTEEESTALLLGMGYVVGVTMMVLEFNLSQNVDATPLPTGFEMRPARPDQLLEVARCLYESYHAEFENGRFTDLTSDEAKEVSGIEQWLAEPRHDLSLMQVVWDTEANRVVAVEISNCDEQENAHIVELAVRPGFRRQKLGRTLLINAINVLKARKVKRIRLNTTKEFKTRAIDLYQAAGFHVVKEFPRYRKQISKSTR